MSTEFKIRMAELCLSTGLKLAKLHSIDQNGNCTCSNIECPSKGKHPLSTGWQNDLIDKHEQLLNFFLERPNSNLAIYADSSETFFALDFDKKNGGLETLKKMEAEYGPLPKTPTVLTGGGGFHFYFSASKETKRGLRGRLTNFPGLDIITKSNLVIPGSLHKSGELYRFQEGHAIGDVPLSELPSAWLSALSKKSNLGTSSLKAPAIGILEGSRNNSLFSEACSLLSKGLGPESVLRTISSLNINNCNPPLEDFEVAQIAESAIRHVKTQISNYAFEDGNTVYYPNGKSESPTVVCNFQARLKSQKKLIDGSDDPPDVLYDIEFLFPKLVPAVYEITPEELEECSFPARIDGALVLYSINKNKAHLRLALRELGDVENRKLMHIMTGWIEHDGKNLYLTSSGSLGREGINDLLRTHEELGGPKDYAIDLPSSHAELINIHKKVLDILEVASPDLTIPFLASVFRAPLIHFLPVDFCLALIGATGSMKSTIAGLFMSFFGKRFSYNSLPGSFTSTANALERQSFLIKDCLFVIDDWVQGEHSINFAERIIRSHGNRQGRARMNKDATLKTVYYPRCLTVLTAEDLQVGQSARARLVILNSYGGAIDKELLSKLQKYATQGDFAKFSGSYVQWIAENWDSISKEINDEFEKYRDFFRENAKHNRTAPNLSHLMIGLIYYGRFCVDQKLMSQIEADQFLKKCKATLIGIAEIQNENQTISDPVEIFLQLLQGAIEADRAHILLPPHVDRSICKYMGYKDGNSYSLGTPKGECIGQFDNGQLTIRPEICMGIVKRYGDEKRMKLHLSAEAMGKQLKARGMLLADENRTTTKRVINGRRERCWVFDNWIQVFNPEFAFEAPKAPVAPVKNATLSHNNVAEALEYVATGNQKMH